MRHHSQIFISSHARPRRNRAIFALRFRAMARLAGALQVCPDQSQLWTLADRDDVIHFLCQPIVAMRLDLTDGIGLQFEIPQLPPIAIVPARCRLPAPRIELAILLLLAIWTPAAQCQLAAPSRAWVLDRHHRPCLAIDAFWLSRIAHGKSSYATLRDATVDRSSVTAVVTSAIVSVTFRAISTTWSSFRVKARHNTPTAQIRAPSRVNRPMVSAVGSGAISVATAKLARMVMTFGWRAFIRKIVNYSEARAHLRQAGKLCTQRAAVLRRIRVGEKVSVRIRRWVGRSETHGRQGHRASAMHRKSGCRTRSDIRLWSSPEPIDAVIAFCALACDALVFSPRVPASKFAARRIDHSYQLFCHVCYAWRREKGEGQTNE